LSLVGTRDEQITRIFPAAGDECYQGISFLRNAIVAYLQQVDLEEQLFKMVWNLVQFACKQHKTSRNMGFHATVPRTR
jgi:hypothetical protein